ncbi:MAG: hypothetical protein ACMUIU_10395 [bacterium]
MIIHGVGFTSTGKSGNTPKYRREDYRGDYRDAIGDMVIFVKSSMTHHSLRINLDKFCLWGTLIARVKFCHEKYWQLFSNKINR